MIGIDLLEIDRLERALERRPRLAERLFTAGEREYAAGRARPGQHLAARFCAKEAVAKALGLEAWAWQGTEGGAGAPGRRAGRGGCRGSGRGWPRGWTSRCPIHARGPARSRCCDERARAAP